MSNRLHIQGEYPADWDAIGDRVRAEAGHRCIRCGHPNHTQWPEGYSLCDERCRHKGPLAYIVASGFDIIPNEDLTAQEMLLAAKSEPQCTGVAARWRILTVHHLTGDKSNCQWWNLLSLCQRCHLTIQSRVNPEIPYFLEHDAWFKPCVAGFYASKYEGRLITREEAMRRMDELLAYERLA